MRRKTHLTKLVIIIICALLIALPVVTYAQDEGNPSDTAAEAGAAQDEAAEGPGLGLGVLLVGLGSVVIVGLAMVARDNYQNQDHPPT